MKRNIKKALKNAFEAPEPVSKELFLRTIPHPKISNRAFVLAQASYIPIWVWGVSFITFMVALISSHYIKKDTLWIISACIPFVAMTAVSENSKSAVYKMAELEIASRFSLKSVVLARLAIIGLAHLVLICLLSPLAGIGNIAATLHAGVYLLVPYLLTTSLSLACTRRFHYRETNYICMGMAVMVSGLCIFTQINFHFFYQKDYFHWWIGLLIVLSLFTVSGYYKTIQKTEALAWNLS